LQRSSFTPGESLSLPPNSITTLVAGQYRGTGAVQYVRPAAVRTEPARKTLTVTRRSFCLDGRLVPSPVAGRAGTGGLLLSVGLDGGGDVVDVRPTIFIIGAGLSVPLEPERGEP
jgi:hypothetical protein